MVQKLAAAVKTIKKHINQFEKRVGYIGVHIGIEPWSIRVKPITVMLKQHIACGDIARQVHVTACVHEENSCTADMENTDSGK